MDWRIASRPEQEDHAMFIRRPTLIATAILALAAVPACATPPAATAPATSASAAPVAGASTVTLTFDGITTPTGVIMVALFDSADAYGGAGAPVRAVAAPVDGTRASVTMSGLVPGRYAAKLFHDINGDGEMQTNSFGMPTEPFAFSNNAPANMGPATWDAAAFTVAAGVTAQTITIP